MAMVGQEVKNGLMRHFLAQGLSGGCRGSGKCEIHIEMFFAHISIIWAENVSMWGLEQQGSWSTSFRVDSTFCLSSMG